MNIDDLKCCGNCKHVRLIKLKEHNETIRLLEYVNGICRLRKTGIYIQSNFLCKGWEHDTVKSKLRKKWLRESRDDIYEGLD